jgi:uncharacterized protein
MNEFDLTHLFQTSRRIAIVGLSPKPERPSYGVARYMQQAGYRIVPVNPGQSEILGEICYPSLSAIPGSIDIVNLFRQEEDVLPIAHEAVSLAKALGIQCFWQQQGIANVQADALLRQAEILSVMDLCIKIEHRRLLG